MYKGSSLSTWEDNMEELEASQSLLEAQIDNLEGGDNDDEDSSKTDVSTDDDGERDNE